MKQLLALLFLLLILSMGLTVCTPPLAASRAVSLVDATEPAPPFPVPTMPPVYRASQSYQADEGPAVVRLALEPGATLRPLVEELRLHLASYAYTLQVVAPGQEADVSLGYSLPEDFTGWSLTATRFVPVVSFWQPVTEVAHADLERIASGQVNDWAAVSTTAPSVGRTSQPIVPLALQTDPPAPLQLHGAAELPSVDALVAALQQNPGGIALLPLEAVDPRLQVLRVDGYDPLLREDLPVDDPLVQTLFLGVAGKAPAAVYKVVAAMARQQHVAAPEPAIQVVVGGDILTGRMVRIRLQPNAQECRSPFDQLRWTFGQADLVIANLEGALSDRIKPPLDPHTFLFVGGGCFAETLCDAGVDGVSLANNHSGNFGTAGISETLALLRGAGVVPFGAGMNLAEARQPAIFTVKGVRFAFLGYDGNGDGYYGATEEQAGTAPAQAELMAADIAAARQQADVVIPFFHWGWEYTYRLSATQEELAHQAVEDGATVVLGSHPHWVQGMERYRGVPILYSLGNLVFDQMWSEETRQGLLARLVFRGKRLVAIRLQAVRIQNFYEPVPLFSSQAAQVFRQVQDASPHWPVEKE